MKLSYYNESGYNVRQYEKIIRNVFKTIGGKKTFNIIFVDKNEIQRINKEYRKIDKVTDVISKEQAKEYGHSEGREFAFLAVHGYLHLCGYDHQSPEEEKVMFGIQENILNKAGYVRKK